MTTSSEYHLREEGSDIDRLLLQIGENTDQLDKTKLEIEDVKIEIEGVKNGIERLDTKKISKPDVPKGLLPYSDGEVGVEWKYPENSGEYKPGYFPGYYINSGGELKLQLSKSLASNLIPLTIKAGNLTIIDSKNYYVQSMFTANGDVLKEVAVNVDNKSASGLIKNSFIVIPQHDYDLELYLRVAKNSEHSAEFTEEELDAIDVKISVLPPTSTMLIQGNIFIYIANSQINIECSSTARAIIRGKYITVQNMGTQFEKPTSGTFYICLGQNGFYLRNATFLTSVDHPIAYYYSDAIFSYGMNDSVICNTIPLTDWYQRKDILIYINNRKLNFTLDNRTNRPYVYDFGYFYCVHNGFNYTSYDGSHSHYENPFYISNSAGLKLTTDSVVKENKTSIANKKILTVGDSVTRRGWYQQQIKTHEPTVEFVGTQTSHYNNIQCEGYSGLRAEDVFGYPNFILPDAPGMANPFYNSTTEKIDFEYYCTTNNIHPDYVVIEFGLNETSSKNYNTYMRNFISSVKAYDSSIIVYVVQPFGESDTGSPYTKTANHRRTMKECVLESYKFEDCVKIPCYFIMVDEYDYDYADVDYGYGDATVHIASDGIHPKEQTGFAKLGDMIYNWLGITE